MTCRLAEALMGCLAGEEEAAEVMLEDADPDDVPVALVWHSYSASSSS